MSISRAQAEGFITSTQSGSPVLRGTDGVHGLRANLPDGSPKRTTPSPDLRKLMGATNPAQAEEGTIRKQFAASIGENAIHGSDAEDTAAFEIGYFFAGIELQ